jgi:hypothetical protein
VQTRIRRRIRRRIAKNPPGINNASRPTRMKRLITSVNPALLAATGAAAAATGAAATGAPYPYPYPYGINIYLLEYQKVYELFSYAFFMLR